MRNPLLAAPTLFLALAACSPAPSSPSSDAAPISASAIDPGRAGGLKTFGAMTRNLYVGIDVGGVLGAPPQELPLRLAQAWAALAQTDFHARAQAIADEIAATGPALVGLQEAALWRTESPGDAFLGGPPDAAEVAYDFLDLLMDALAERGLHYDVAAVVQNVDIELPVPVSLEPLELIDVRLTDRGAILVRQELAWANPAAVNFAVALPITIGDPQAPLARLDYLRGYTAVDVKFRGEWLRFVNTQLEAFAEQVRYLQAQELLAALGETDLPVVAVGDFNSVPGASPTYALLTSALTDAWAARYPDQAGPTCCIDDPVLMDPTPTFDERIDLVLFRGPFLPLALEVVGDAPEDRTASGLWPSDHAGLVATLRQVEPRFFALWP